MHVMVAIEGCTDKKLLFSGISSTITQNFINHEESQSAQSISKKPRTIEFTMADIEKHPKDTTVEEQTTDADRFAASIVPQTDDPTAPAFT